MIESCTVFSGGRLANRLSSSGGGVGFGSGRSGFGLFIDPLGRPLFFFTSDVLLDRLRDEYSMSSGLKKSGRIRLVRNRRLLLSASSGSSGFGLLSRSDLDTELLVRVGN